MTTIYRLSGREGRSWWSAPLLALAAAGLVGCGSLLEVGNPNNIKSEDTEKPVAATSLVNGAERQVSFGVSSVLLPIAEISDELEWVGSRDGWLELDQGKVSNGYNEFTDVAMPALAAARWLADDAITVLEAQQTAAKLLDPLDLAKAYLWGGIAYVTIADWFDDFVFSTKDTAGSPIGHANMRGLYATAVTYLTKGLAIANAEGDADLALTITAMRARAHFDAAIWDKVAGGGMVSAASADVAAAVADAQAFLAAATDPTWRFDFTYGPTIGQSDPGGWINSRHEMRLASPYVAAVPTNKWGATTLLDPIDGTPDPAVDFIQNKFKDEDVFAGYTVVSAREMHLIIAEARLAAGNTGAFQTAINNLRDLDGLSDWTGAAGQPTALAMLQYERMANLFMQGRRLADHYRFGIASPEWLAGSEAASKRVFLPISARECLSNPNILAEKCSGG